MTPGSIITVVLVVFGAIPVGLSFYYWVRDIEKDVEELKDRHR